MDIRLRPPGTHFAHRPRRDTAKLAIARSGQADAGSVAAVLPPPMPGPCGVWGLIQLSLQIIGNSYRVRSLVSLRDNKERLGNPAQPGEGTGPRPKLSASNVLAVRCREEEAQVGTSPGEVTRLLKAMRAGDAAADDDLLPLVYAELHRIAEAYMRRERPDHTLQATALINEAYLRLVGEEIDWNDRGHFIGLAAHVMRRVLVDYARQHNAERRAGGLARTLQTAVRQSLGTSPFLAAARRWWRKSWNAPGAGLAPC
jgi:hypothetical protein